MKEISINKKNTYIQAAKHIKALCNNGQWDTQTAVSMWEHETGYTHNHALHFEFLDTVNALGGLDNLINRL